MATNTVGNMVEMDGRSKRTRAVVLGTALALVAGIGSRVTDLVTGLAVEEAVVAALSVDGGSTGQADGAVSVKLEYLHRHTRRILFVVLKGKNGLLVVGWFLVVVGGAADNFKRKKRNGGGVKKIKSSRVELSREMGDVQEEKRKATNGRVNVRSRVVEGQEGS
ncbi:MAG: hypothetical protein J3R72DRAFT_176002 [Linnemannia gamsii]|nr:MAG: hypothetical protein J3R72DRAFT_176002 [Linnemannia gamsii]